jgi:hypothetical protein
LLDHPLNIALQCLYLFFIDRPKRGQHLHAGLYEGLVLQPFGHANALHSLNYQLHDALVAHHPLDVHHCADLVKVFELGIVAGGVLGSRGYARD